jgi:hypothetical protein
MSLSSDKSLGPRLLDLALGQTVTNLKVEVILLKVGLATLGLSLFCTAYGQALLDRR